jgi:TonB family protein
MRLLEAFCCSGAIGRPTAVSASNLVLASPHGKPLALVYVFTEMRVVRLSPFLYLTVSLSAFGPAQAVTPPRAPTGKWIVEFADNMCVLQRDYGSKELPLTLAFRPSPMAKAISLYLFSPKTGQQGAEQEITIGFGPNSPETKSHLRSFDVPNKPFRYNDTYLKREELDRSSKGGLLTLQARGNLDVALKVPGIRDALSVLDDCTKDLLEDWGLSRAVQQSIASPPEPRRPLLTSKDFPVRALGLNATNSARVNVSAEGRPDSCTIVETSRDRDLDDALCKALLRAKYKPAVDHSGKPMASLFFSRVQWRSE